MKLIAIYSVFDGEELLEFSIKSIKNCVDYVLVIYQTISNFGIQNEGLETKIMELKNKGLVDEYIHFNTDSKNPQLNELTKRNIGLDRAKELGFTHFITIDCDEFYFEKEFVKSKKYFIENDLDSSVCWIQNYHQKPEYRIIGLSEPYKVPFINKLYKETKLVLNGRYFTDMIDPTRKTNNFVKNKIFDKEEIMMHHYTTIRKDIRKKYESWTCRINFKNNKIIDELCEKVINYDINHDEPKCEIVNNHFKIKI